MISLYKRTMKCKVLTRLSLSWTCICGIVSARVKIRTIVSLILVGNHLTRDQMADLQSDLLHQLSQVKLPEFNIHNRSLIVLNRLITNRIQAIFLVMISKC